MTKLPIWLLSGIFVFWGDIALAQTPTSQTFNLQIPASPAQSYQDSGGNTWTLTIPTTVAIGTLQFVPKSTPSAAIVNYNHAIAGNSVTSMQVTLPSVTAGNAVFLGVGWGDPTGYNTNNVADNTVTITDSAGNITKMAADKTVTGVPEGASLFHFPVKNGSTGTETFTISFSAPTGYPVADVIQVSNLPSTLPLDGTVQSSSGNPSVSVPMTLTSANDFVYAFFAGLNDGTLGAGQTGINSDPSSSGIMDSYMLATASGSFPQSDNNTGGSVTGIAIAIQ